jgi:hypothetical protein
MKHLGGMTMLVVALAGCGGAQDGGGGKGLVQDFKCRGRRIEYTVTGGLAGVESGVTIICREPTPTLKKWRAAEGGGDKGESATHGMTQMAFDGLWKKIESTGWRYLDNCDNPAAADDDPVYTVDVADDKSSVSLSCAGQARSLPFPFDRLVNELDLEAAGFPD